MQQCKNGERFSKCDKKWIENKNAGDCRGENASTGRKWSKADKQIREEKKNVEKLAKREGRQQGVLQTTGNVEQVRRTIGEHGFLEQGQRIMGYGTRHKGHIRNKQRGCGLGSGEAGKMGRHHG